MLALMINDKSTELFLPTGEFVEVPQSVLKQAGKALELATALRWSYKAGMISHKEFLLARDLLVTDRKAFSVDLNEF